MTNAELKFENNFGPFTIVHGYLKNLDPDLYSKSRWPSNADPDHSVPVFNTSGHWEKPVWNLEMPLGAGTKVLRRPELVPIFE